MFFVNISYAQRYEIGLFAGGNNIIGDVSSKSYVEPTGLTLGGVFKWNVNERLALRGNLYGSIVNQKIENSWFPYDNDMSNKFGSSNTFGVITIDAVAEWNVFDYDLRKKKSHTPYMYIGVGGVIYNPVVHYSSSLKSNTDVELYTSGNVIGATVSIPFGLGYKYAVSEKMVLAVDFGFRYTFSDNLDGSNYDGDKRVYPTTKPEDYNKTETIKVGNLNSNDWLTTIGLTLTYVFGRDPCACDQ